MVASRDFNIGNTRILITLAECTDPEQILKRIARTAREQLTGAEERRHGENNQRSAGAGVHDYRHDYHDSRCGA